MDGENIENDTKTKNDSVDGNNFVRFRGGNSVFKFIRISVDRTLLTKVVRLIHHTVNSL